MCNTNCPKHQPLYSFRQQGRVQSFQPLTDLHRKRNERRVDWSREEVKTLDLYSPSGPLKHEALFSSAHQSLHRQQQRRGHVVPGLVHFLPEVHLNGHFQQVICERATALGLSEALKLNSKKESPQFIHDTLLTFHFSQILKLKIDYSK